MYSYSAFEEAGRKTTTGLSGYRKERGIELNGSVAAAWKQRTAQRIKRIQSQDIQLA